MRRAGSILADRIPHHRHRRTHDRYAHLRRMPEDHETCSVRSVLRPRRAEHFTCQFRQRHTALDQRYLTSRGGGYTRRERPSEKTKFGFEKSADFETAQCRIQGTGLIL